MTCSADRIKSKYHDGYERLHVTEQLMAVSVSRITGTVRASGGLREKLFNVAYNAKKQAVENGEYLNYTVYIMASLRVLNAMKKYMLHIRV